MFTWSLVPCIRDSLQFSGRRRLGRDHRSESPCRGTSKGTLAVGSDLLYSPAAYMDHTFRHAALLGLALVLAAGCSPAIGDDCETSIDCSVNGDRICDVASPGGYCTVQPCDPGNCPDEAVCVEFLFDPARLSSSWCMASCEGSDDCRTEDGYTCVHASQMVDEALEPLARVLDASGDGARFCAVQ